MLTNQHIILNSKTATEINSYKNKAIFQLQRPIEIPSNLECNISIKSFSYANCFYNVTEKSNILYTSLGNITITPGSHTIYTLLTALNSNGYGITFSYDTLTFRITAISNVNFQILDGATSIHQKLGYSVPTSNSLSLTGINVIALQGVSSIQIQLNNLNIQSNSVIGGLDNIICYVPNNVSSGSINMYLPNIHNYRINKEYFNLIEVNLYDEQNDDLNFQGQNWEISMFITFQYIRKFDKPESLLNSLRIIQNQNNNNVVKENNTEINNELMDNK